MSALKSRRSPSPAVYAGNTLTYTVTVTLTGEEDATGVTVTDTLPQAISSNVTASTSVAGVTPTIVGNVVTADFGTVRPNTRADADDYRAAHRRRCATNHRPGVGHKHVG